MATLRINSPDKIKICQILKRYPNGLQRPLTVEKGRPWNLADSSFPAILSSMVREELLDSRKGREHCGYCGAAKPVIYYLAPKGIAFLNIYSKRKAKL